MAATERVENKMNQPPEKQIIDEVGEHKTGKGFHVFALVWHSPVHGGG
jgi:hypothetical protein